jgi:class 3 adenylate cyclase
MPDSPAAPSGAGASEGASEAAQLSAVRRPLFRKYFVALFAAVTLPLIASGGVEAWFGYRDQRASLDELLRVEAAAAAARIGGFIEGIRDQMGWLVQLPWSAEPNERHQIDALRLLRQVPAISDITLVDGTGKERLYVSRISLDRAESGLDRSTDPAVRGARANRVWYGPVTYYRDTEPRMTIAVAGNRAAVGVAQAEINLKHIWDVISAIRVGRTGKAFVLDRPGRLLAHPDISMVLRGADDPGARPLQALRDTVLDRGGGASLGTDETGRTVMAAVAPIPGVDWAVVVELPVTEAFAPIYAALWRTGILLVLGTLLAAALAYWLARRMVGPIAKLEAGAERIGAGQFDHRIDIRTGDEFQRLGTSFNRMAAELSLSQERSERIARLRQFLAPQVAELVDRIGDDSMLEGQRRDVVAVFCDLRGFTAFAAGAEPETIMKVLGEYHTAVGAVILRYGATLTSFSGDGLMVLVNAPVPCPEPVLQAARMAVQMQADVQALIVGWRTAGHELGFGIGLAAGEAIVGRIGYEGRLDYTAIGNVVNLASRLCSSAGDRQILVDAITAEALEGRMPLVPLEARVLKGYDRELTVFTIDEVAGGSAPHAAAVPVATV